MQEESRQRQSERTKVLNERTKTIDEKKAASIDEKTAFIVHRAELSNEIQRYIKELGPNESLVEALKWLKQNVEASRSSEDLNRYEKSYRNSTLPKVKARISDKRIAAISEEFNRQMANMLDNKKTWDQSTEETKKKQEQTERKRHLEQIQGLCNRIKPLDYYLHRKELN